MRHFFNRSRVLFYLTFSGLPGVTLGAPPELLVCTDYHCDQLVSVQLRAHHWRRIGALFADTDSPADEREHLRQAIALLEDLIGSMTGTWRDRGGNFAGVGQKGQLDCIAESTNTTAYLNLLESAGLLRWHRIAPRKRRNPLFFNVHWTAVIIEKASGDAYAVDSWYLDNGQPPYVQRLDDWMSGQRPDGGQEDLGHQ
jgi:hypothetical protein